MHNINILLNPNDGGSRIAVQMLDGELEKVNAACGREAPLGDKMNALNGPGLIFAQVFPQMGNSGKALGINLKAVVLDEIAAFVEISAEQYDCKLGGKKGNISLVSFDGGLKVAVQISEYITFDERLQVAKALIDECIHAWSNGADDKILTLVNDAFQVDKQGNVSTGRILGLRRLKIDDAQWQQAMQAIADSMTTAGSKTYIRAYERIGQTDQWKVISLDFAALEVA